MRISRGTRISLRVVALGYLFALLAVPIAVILWRTFSPGVGEFVASVSTPAAQSAINLSLLIVAIVVPLNVLFGVATALALVRGRYRGRGLLKAVLDLPFAVSPIVVGVSLILLWGANGWFGGLESLGFKVIFGLPGMVIATLFVTLPFVVRSVQPVLIEADREVEEAAASLGASNWTTFRRIVLPTLAPAVLGGTGLAFARAIGEYGSVVLIGGNIPRETQVASQYIQQQIEIDEPVNAAAISVVLLVIAFIVLTILRLVGTRASRRGGGRS
jgi:sulfate transport system permease protein